MKSLMHRFSMLTVLLVIAGLMQVAFAQQGGGGMGGGQGMRMSPKDRAEALGKQLSLDSATVVKVTAIMEKYQKEMMEKRNAMQDDMDGMRAAMMELREKQTKEIAALLTKEQAAKYDEILKQQQQRMQNRPPRNN
ncbi:MAG TPA: hypothetical protein VMH23_12310 [Bacteroidota bacterium]|nr:hypothetical protein [Bacteroidota bacterium]